MVRLLKCHMFASRMPQLSNPNATPQQVKWLGFKLLRCGIAVIHPCKTGDVTVANEQCVRDRRIMRFGLTDHAPEADRRSALKVKTGGLCLPSVNLM